MYMRHGSLFEDFIVEEKTQSISTTGRVNTKFTYKATGNIVRGVLAKANAIEVEKWHENQHPVTHTIVQKFGKAQAKEGDRLVNGSRFFYVQGVSDVAMRGYFILYYVEERKDTV